MGALKEGHDYSHEPCYDDGMAVATCLQRAAESPSTNQCMMAYGETAGMENEEGYESCTTLAADWGPDGAKCTEEAIQMGQWLSTTCTTGTCGEEFLTALICTYTAIKSECPTTPLCGEGEAALTASLDSVLALN